MHADAQRGGEGAQAPTLQRGHRAWQPRGRNNAGKGAGRTPGPGGSSLCPPPGSPSRAQAQGITGASLTCDPEGQPTRENRPWSPPAPRSLVAFVPRALEVWFLKMLDYILFIAVV